MIKLIVAAVGAQLLAGFAIGQESETPNDEPPATAQDAPADVADQDGSSSEVKSLLGISILGNEEAPKSLVIVPWKSSEIGDGIGVDQVLDDRPVPVDKDVFLRELRYYQIRSSGAE